MGQAHVLALRVAAVARSVGVVNLRSDKHGRRKRHPILLITNLFISPLGHSLFAFIALQSNHAGI